LLQIDPPQYAHLPSLRTTKGQKIQSKSKYSLSFFRDQGFLSEALLNTVAFAGGWSPPHREDPNILAEAPAVFMKYEVMTLQDMIAQFNLDKVNKGVTNIKEEKEEDGEAKDLEFDSTSGFSRDKLVWFNAQHLRKRFEYTKGNVTEES